MTWAIRPTAALELTSPPAQPPSITVEADSGSRRSAAIALKTPAHAKSRQGARGHQVGTLFLARQSSSRDWFSKVSSSR